MATSELRRARHFGVRLAQAGIVACCAALLLAGAGIARAATPDDPHIREAVARAVEHLKKIALKGSPGQQSLAGMAMLKSGVRPDTPVVKTILDSICKRIVDGKPGGHPHSNYGYAVDLMCLEAADPVKYHDEIQILTDFIVSKQNRTGDWDYFHSVNKDEGDTSQSQYALLALWTAVKAGVRVPLEVFDEAGRWHVQTQHGDGGFSYHPRGPRNNGIEHAMTVAGAASVYISRMHLYPSSRSFGDGKSSEKKSDKSEKSKPKKFGVLEELDLDKVGSPADGAETGEDDEPGDADAKREFDPEFNATVPLKFLNRSLRGAGGWITARYTVDTAKPRRFPFYYMYGLERMATLMDLDRIAGHDWYTEGSEHLLSLQQPDGAFKKSGNLNATAFSVLFLIRSTAMALGKRTDIPLHGAGLMVNGQGLPSDLKEYSLEDGKVVVPKVLGEIDELLSELANPESEKVLDIQQTLVATFQLGDPEKLIGQKDLLVKLTRDPRAEVRRTAVWALGHCDDLALAGVLINALRDQNLDVVVEARNALCTLSRRPLGFGLSMKPAEAAGPTASDEQRNDAVEAWRNEALARWGSWYLSVRPYAERDDIDDIRLRSKDSKKKKRRKRTR